MSEGNLTETVSSLLPTSDGICMAFGLFVVVFAIIFVISTMVEYTLDGGYSVHKKTCSKCNKKGYFGFIELKSGEFLCKKCSAEKEVICIGCKTKFPIIEMRIFEKEYHCPTCYKKYYRTFNNFNFHLQFPESKTFNENKYKEFCGVEIECLNSKKNKNCFIKSELKELGINQYEDGSLSAGGIEFSTWPSNGDDLLKKIRDFCEILKKRDYYVNNSCGLHLHIQTKEDIQLIKKIIIFYSKFERLFGKYVSDNRRKSNYCGSIKSKYNKLKELEDVLACKTIKDLKELVYNGYTFDARIHSCDRRYCWLNLHSIFYRGTLELRSHGGTVNKDKIINWIKIHLTIRDYLKKISFEKLMGFEGTIREFNLIIENKALRNYTAKRIYFFNDTSKREFDFMEKSKKLLEEEQ